MLVMDDNQVAKIGVLGPAAPIFAKITWITIMRQDAGVAKIGVLGPAASIFAEITWITIPQPILSEYRQMSKYPLLHHYSPTLQK
jgi:hypothetical protein